MKRFICIAVALLLLLGTLTGCHGSKKQTVFEIPEEFDGEKQYTITFWAKNDNNTVQQNIYKNTVASFEELYPNINVELKLYSDYGLIYNDVITNISTGTTPNVCITYPDHIATYMTGEDTVVPLDGLMADEKFGLGGSEVRFDAPKKDEIIGKYLEEGVIGGVQYALPFMRSSEACYINKDLVEKLGYTLPETLTWDFVWEVSEKAMEKDADGNFIVNGQKVLIPCIYKSTDNMMIQALRQQGAPYSTESGEIGLFNDTAKELLFDIAEHTASGAFSTFKISSYPGNFLNAGQCIFAIDSTAGATWMGAHSPQGDIHADRKVEFETEVMAIPQYDPENPMMISQGPSVCIFNKEDSGEVLASWLFLQYLLTNDIQIAYSQTEGYVPVTTKAQESDEYVDYLSRAGEDNQLYYQIKLDAVNLLLNNVENTFVTPVFNGSASLRKAAGDLIEFVNKDVRAKKPVDRARIFEIFDSVETLHKLDQIGAVDGEITFGKLPKGAIALISGLAFCWICIGIYVVVDKLHRKK